MFGSPDAPESIAKTAKSRFDAARTAYVEHVRAAQNDLAKVERDRERQLGDARRRLQEATKTYERMIEAAEKRLTEATTGTLLGAYKNLVRLYNNRLETPDGSVSLSSQIRAAVEATGTKTSSSDTRETVLLLDTPKFDSVIRCSPDETVAARELAAKINTAAKNAEDRISEYARTLAEAESGVVHAKEDTAPVDAARGRLRGIEAARDELDHARARLADAEAEKHEVEARRRELLEIDPRAKVDEVKAPRRSVRTAAWPVAASAFDWWRRRSKKAKAGIIVAAVLVAITVLGSLGNTNISDRSTEVAAETTGAATTQEATTQEAPTVQPVSVVIRRPRRATVRVRESSFTIRGQVTPGATVRMNGDLVKVTGGRFAKKVRLTPKRNDFFVKAMKPGMSSVEKEVTIVRTMPRVKLSLSAPRYDTLTGLVVRASTVTVRGRVTQQSRVAINRQPVPLSGNQFVSEVALKQGRNVIYIRADRKGFSSTTKRITVIRRLTAAEISALLEQRRQAFINASTTIPYNQLIKNPDAYRGRRVKYYGEILQIQEGGGAGFMLLQVTDLGYDIWDDVIWINYTGHVRGGDGDQLTVYGKVVGTKSYETQIGGETYVPEIDAKYIVE